MWKPGVEISSYENSLLRAMRMLTILDSTEIGIVTLFNASIDHGNQW